MGLSKFMEVGMLKIETTEEFLARGGKLTRVAPGKSAHISTRDWQRAVRGHGLAKCVKTEAAYNSVARVDSV